MSEREENELEYLSVKEILLIVIKDLEETIAKNEQEAEQIKRKHPYPACSNNNRFNFVWGKIKSAQYTRDHIVKKFSSILGMQDNSMKCPLANYEVPCQYGYPSRTKCFRCERIKEL